MMRVRSVVLAYALVCACETTPGLELPDALVGETRDLQVYRHSSGAEVCGGTPASWQAHVEAVGAFFGSDGPFGPFPVIIVGQDAISLYCGAADNSGCTSHRPLYSAGRLKSMPHELAHLVDIDQTGAPRIPFWREGFAEAWSDRGSTLPRRAALDDLLTDRARDVHYPDASHFVQWIADAYGPDRVAAFLQKSDRDDRPEERAAQFEKILGEPYAVVQERFWREAPLYYPGFGRCGATDHVVPAGGRLDLSARLDCATDPGPLEKWPGAPERTSYTTRVIDVEQSGRYRVVAEPGRAWLLPCDASDDPLLAPKWVRDEDDVYDSGPKSSTVHRLDAGRYKLWLVSTAEAAVDLRVLIGPARPFVAHVH